MTVFTRADDVEILEMLDMRDGEGMPLIKIAQHFGATRNSIAGKLHRIDTAELPCQCTKPENKNGGMGRGWWK